MAFPPPNTETVDATHLFERYVPRLPTSMEAIIKPSNDLLCTTPLSQELTHLFTTLPQDTLAYSPQTRILTYTLDSSFLTLYLPPKYLLSPHIKPQVLSAWTDGITCSSRDVGDPIRRFIETGNDQGETKDLEEIIATFNDLAFFPDDGGDEGSEDVDEDEMYLILEEESSLKPMMPTIAMLKTVILHIPNLTSSYDETCITTSSPISTSISPPPAHPQPPPEIIGLSKLGMDGMVIFSGPIQLVNRYVQALRIRYWKGLEVRYEEDVEWEFGHGLGWREFEEWDDVFGGVGVRWRGVLGNVLEGSGSFD